MISAIILAAGTSKRMGTANKLLLDYKGQSILNKTISEINASDADELILVLGHERDQVKASINCANIKYAFNKDFEKGMTSSIQVGVRAAAINSTAYAICLADLPEITSKSYNLIWNSFRNSKVKKQLIVTPVFNEKQGNPIVFSSDFRELILKHTEPNGCKLLLKKYSNNRLNVQMDTSSILNDIDTLKDYNQKNHI